MNMLSTQALHISIHIHLYMHVYMGLVEVSYTIQFRFPCLKCSYVIRKFKFSCLLPTFHWFVF
jgi:hypothetical protein